MADVIPNTPPSCAETEPVTVATVAVVVIDPVVEDVGVSVPEMEDGTFSVPLIVESWTETVPVIKANETREPLTDTDWAETEPPTVPIVLTDPVVLELDCTVPKMCTAVEIFPLAVED
jgi:hypothetical protein